MQCRNCGSKLKIREGKELTSCLFPWLKGTEQDKMITKGVMSPCNKCRGIIN